MTVRMHACQLAIVAFRGAFDGGQSNPLQAEYYPCLLQFAMSTIPHKPIMAATPFTGFSLGSVFYFWLFTL